jgi:FMN-dependent NADH-azoreductase
MDLFALPLWNWSIPYKKKHLIDLIPQKDVVFSFDESGFGGLLRGRKAVVIYARGLDNAPTSATPAGGYDFQRPYMEMWLRFVGIEDIESITVEKILPGAGVDLESRAAAKSQAKSLGCSLVGVEHSR